MPRTCSGTSADRTLGQIGGSPRFRERVPGSAVRSYLGWRSQFRAGRPESQQNAGLLPCDQSQGQLVRPSLPPCSEPGRSTLNASRRT